MQRALLEGASGIRKRAEEMSGEGWVWRCGERTLLDQRAAVDHGGFDEGGADWLPKPLGRSETVSEI